MKTLWIIRHAKSSWEDPLLIDHARPLNERGKRDAMALGKFLAEQKSVPDVWLVSDSKRTRKTFKRIQDSFPMALDFEMEGHLYHASVSHLIRRIGALSNQLSHVAMVGHNPGLTDLCAHFGFPAVDLPTSGFVCYGLVDWDKAALGEATCIGGWFPKTGKWGYLTE
jgi:phosphohistidine phosphatase